MYDPEAEFSLTWAPPRYPAFDARADGVWRPVFEGTEPVGIVWQSGDGAGVKWVTQSKNIEDLRQHFEMSLDMGLTGRQAYDTLPSTVKVGDERSGVMSTASRQLSAMDED